MKVKLDFITNSSTTCFVVMGACIKRDDISDEYLKLVAEKQDKTLEEVKERDYFYETLDTLLQGTDLQFTFGPEWDYEDQPMIGIGFTAMNDDETFKQFKNRVQLQVLESTGLKIQPYYIEEAWRDG